ncbi:hypothetical protein C1H76_5187 [Elsinoe australis]|uniref:Uncharacterized protein n=1 Tax=Elsinoe australis TaxID=40998 RepID=A0A4U7AYP6_9PEZI|nr:hypothetical protein C1H76_5187 [Elsinoe australis]
MSITEIQQFKVHSSEIPQKMHNIAAGLKDSPSSDQVTIGVQVGNEGAVQITSEGSWSNVGHDIFGEPRRSLHVAFNGNLFGTNGPAVANVVEYVANWFPVSKLTPDYQSQIESDFQEFDRLIQEGTPNADRIVFGWSIDPQEHAEFKGETARCFVIARAWNSMGEFEQTTKTEQFGRAIPILQAWRMPF